MSARSTDPMLDARCAHEAHFFVDMLQFSRLVLLFGDGGSGKTTLLQDWVLPALRNASVPGESRHVVYFDDWNNAPLGALSAQIEAALPAEVVRQADPPLLRYGPWIGRLAAWTAQPGQGLVLVFDHFERYLATTVSDGVDAFARQLIAALAAPALRVQFLIALRSAAEPLLMQRLGGRIAALGDNRIVLPPPRRRPHGAPVGKPGRRPARAPGRAVPVAAEQRPTQGPTAAAQRAIEAPIPAGQRATETPIPAGQRATEAPIPARQRATEAPIAAAQRATEAPPPGQRAAEVLIPAGRRPTQALPVAKGQPPHHASPTKNESIEVHGIAQLGAESPPPRADPRLAPSRSVTAQSPGGSEPTESPPAAPALTQTAVQVNAPAPPQAATAPIFGPRTERTEPWLDAAADAPARATADASVPRTPPNDADLFDDDLFGPEPAQPPPSRPRRRTFGSRLVRARDARGHRRCSPRRSGIPRSFRRLPHPASRTPGRGVAGYGDTTRERACSGRSRARPPGGILAVAFHNACTDVFRCTAAVAFCRAFAVAFRGGRCTTSLGTACASGRSPCGDTGRVAPSGTGCSRFAHQIALSRRGNAARARGAAGVRCRHHHGARPRRGPGEHRQRAEHPRRDGSDDGDRATYGGSLHRPLRRARRDACRRQRRQPQHRRPALAVAVAGRADLLRRAQPGADVVRARDRRPPHQPRPVRHRRCTGVRAPLLAPLRRANVRCARTCRSDCCRCPATPGWIDRCRRSA
jgi:hypothetical protein